MNLEMPDGRNDLERRFLAEFNARRGVVDVWIWPDRPLITSLCVFDRDEGGGVIRTLRADFDGETLRCGRDPTQQFVGDLDPDDPDGYVLGGGRSPEDLAAAAVAWYKRHSGTWFRRHPPWRRTILNGWRGPGRPARRGCASSRCGRRAAAPPGRIRLP